MMLLFMSLDVCGERYSDTGFIVVHRDAVQDILSRIRISADLIDCPLSLVTTIYQNMALNTKCSQTMPVNVCNQKVEVL